MLQLTYLDAILNQESIALIKMMSIILVWADVLQMDFVLNPLPEKVVSLEQPTGKIYSLNYITRNSNQICHKYRLVTETKDYEKTIIFKVN